MGQSFVEIEHKFLVGKEFSRAAFLKKARELGATRVEEIAVKDTYYVLKNWPTHVFRHRFDSEIQQLTVKGVGSSTFERLEVNLDLMRDGIDQSAAIQAFLGVFGVAWQAALTKDIGVAYYPDCEVVHYNATTGRRDVSCVEFEAIGFSDGLAALPTLHQYEQSFGFDAHSAESQSLFQLLLLAEAPQDIQKLFLK